MAILPTTTLYASEASPQAEYDVSVTIVSVPTSIISSGLSGFGHAFLVVNNDSTVAVTIGHMRVPAETAITIGTFGNRSAHYGIWYNIEAYHGVSGGWAASYTLSYDEIATLNSAINYHDSYSATDNCACFARDVWNSVVPSSYQVSGSLPTTLAASISRLEGATSSYSLPQKDKGDIAYQTSTSVTYDESGADADVTGS